MTNVSEHRNATAVLTRESALLPLELKCQSSDTALYGFVFRGDD